MFDALYACFESDRGSGEEPQQLHESRPMVWLGTFEVTEARECAAPARLSSSVEADAQGSYWAIERLRSTLDVGVLGARPVLGLRRPGTGTARAARKPVST